MTRLAQNTGWLYGRHLVGAIADFIAVRIALGALGVEGYGVYSAVVGVVFFALTFQAVFATTAERFLSRAVGLRTDVSNSFSAVLFLSLVLSIMTVLAGETIGRWFVLHRLSIPSAYASSVILVMRTGVAVVVLRILRIPFAAQIFAHERMRLLAQVSLVGAGCVLLSAGTAWFLRPDALVTYAVAVAVGEGVVTLTCAVWSVRAQLPGCRISRPQRERLLEMFSFFSWNTLSAFGNLLKYRFVNVLLNVFAGVALNATWSLSLYAGCVLSALTTGFQGAFQPVIYKAWAAGEAEDAAQIVGGATVGAGLLAAIPGVPVFVLAPQVLTAILSTDLPPQAVAFVRCIVLNVVFDAVSGPLTAGVLASGRVAVYQVAAFGCAIAGTVGAFLVLSAGLPAWMSLGSVVVSNGAATAYRYFCVWRLLGRPPCLTIGALRRSMGR